MERPFLLAAVLLLPAVLHAQTFEQQLQDARRRIQAERGPARTVVASEAIALRAAAEQPMDLGSETFQGTLKQAHGVSISLPGGFRLSDGPVSLKYGMPSWRSAFSGERSVSLSQRGLSVALPIERKVFDSFGSFATSAEPTAPLMLKGSRSVRQTGQAEREAEVSCTYSGYCYACGMKFDGEVGCGFGFHVSCSGDRQARQRVTTFETVETIAVLSAGGARRLGEITGPARQSQKVETLEYLSSCH